MMKRKKMIFSGLLILLSVSALSVYTLVRYQTVTPKNPLAALNVEALTEDETPPSGNKVVVYSLTSVLCHDGGSDVCPTNLKRKDYPSAVEGASSVSHNGREWLLLLPIVLLVGSFFLYRIKKPGTPDSVSVEAFLPNGFLSEIQAKVNEIYNQRYPVNDRINSLSKLLHLETRKDFLRFFESNMPTSFAQAEDKELTEMDKTLLYLLMVKEFETQDLAYLLKIKTRTVYTGRQRLCDHLNLGSARELKAYLNARLKKARELQPARNKNQVVQ